MNKRSVAFLLMVTMVVFAVTAYAGILRLAHTDSVLASLSINGNASCEGKAVAQDRSASVALTVTLQKQATNGTWSLVNSWSDTGTGSVKISKTQSISSGTYRVRSTSTINGETVTVYSSTKTK